MAELEFQFSEIDDEIRMTTELAKDFLDPSSLYVLRQLQTSLEQIRGCKTGRSRRWCISENQPLCTETSRGAYEIGGHGRHSVFAKVTSVWEIEPLGQHNQGSLTKRRFALAGKASTMVRILEGSARDAGQQLAMWRMEIGDENSPGCHFHVQVLGESDDYPFPHSLCIPRLPNLFVTPMSVLDFVLGELFQEDWSKHRGGGTSIAKQWNKLQSQRFVRLLKWKTAEAETKGTAWIALKTAKPPANLFG